jgi:hypothetical protein
VFLEGEEVRRWLLREGRRVKKGEGKTRGRKKKKEKEQVYSPFTFEV